MTWSKTRTARLAAAAAVLSVLAGAGCGDNDTTGLEPFAASDDPVVFDDDFGTGVDFQAFLNSKVDAVSIDRTEAFAGVASLKIEVPGPEILIGNFAGGAFAAVPSRDFSGYDALTFYAKASMAATLNIAGYGNDNTGTSKFDASLSDIPLTTEWTKVVIPIPFPERLTLEDGLFWFAEGHENNTGYDIWLDEVRFEKLEAFTNIRPKMPNQSIEGFIGGTANINFTSTTFAFEGSDITVDHLPGYFTFTSSDPTVAEVTESEILLVGSGTAEVTATLGSIDAIDPLSGENGKVTVDAVATPTTTAPVPTHAPEDVISLFSGPYPDVAVGRFSTDWDIASVMDFFIGNEVVKAYTGLVFAGIEVAGTIDAREMTHFHIDVWVPKGNDFKIKLVDFGADGAFGGTDDREHEVVFNSESTPPFTTGEWISLDIPLSDFTNLETRGNIAQLILAQSGGTIAFVDNIYFRR